MKIEKGGLPDKIFGIDTPIIMLWLEPIGLGAVLIISMIAVIVPKFGEISAKMGRIKAVMAKTEEVNQKRVYLQTVDQDEVKKNANKFALALLPEKSSYLLVRVVRNAAAGVNFAIDDFSISMGDIKADDAGTKGASSFDKIPVVVTLVGPRENYLSLVNSIEKSLPLMSIDSFDMRTVGNTSLVKMNISAYYLRDISDLKVENLKLVDLTPSQEEFNLLSKINDYRTLAIEGNTDGGNFVDYGRNDPFFTP